MNNNNELTSEFIAKLDAVTGKRAKTVIDHIRKHGSISTEELKEIYGYSHPPRAARDVREEGIPLKTIKVKGSDGRTIGAYQFDLDKKIQGYKSGGRRTFSKKFKKELCEVFDNKCAICMEEYEERYMQVDHRIPYEIAGEQSSELILTEFMYLCGSCNRAKSWSCEHCPNTVSEVCANCYWANPTEYEHIATVKSRRIALTWSGKEVTDFDQLTAMAKKHQAELPDYVKAILQKVIQNFTN